MCHNVSAVISAVSLLPDHGEVELFVYAKDQGGAGGGVSGHIGLSLPNEGFRGEFCSIHSWPPRKEDLGEALAILLNNVRHSRNKILLKFDAVISNMLRVNAEEVQKTLLKSATLQ